MPVAAGGRFTAATGLGSLPEHLFHDDLRVLDAPDEGVDHPAVSAVEEEDAGTVLMS